MSTLVAVAYEDEFKAQEMRVKLLRMQRSHLVDLEDAVVVRPKGDGKVKLEQLTNLAALGAMGGGFWGLLIGALFMSPLLGFALGAGTGAASGALSDVGIDDEFMKELAAQLEPGGSVLFVLIRQSTPDKVLEELRGTGGKVIHSSLSHTDEERLQAALDG